MWSIGWPKMPWSSNSAALRSPGAQALSGLSIVIPVHDEAEVIGDVIAAVRAAVPEVAFRWELVVVDDGSADGTAAVLDAMELADARLRVVRHDRNRGYGAALRSGFAAARFEWVFYMDGDGQLDPGQLPDAVAALADADGVVGYRVHRADPLLRRLNAALWNGLVRSLLGVAIRDLNCAFKLLPRRLLAPDSLFASGAVLSAEIVARAARSGCRLAEIPIEHRPRRRGRSSGGRPSVMLRAAWELPRLYWRLRRESPA